MGHGAFTIAINTIKLVTVLAATRRRDGVPVCLVVLV